MRQLYNQMKLRKFAAIGLPAACGFRLNRRLAQWRVKWLIEHSTSHSRTCGMVY